MRTPGGPSRSAGVWFDNESAGAFWPGELGSQAAVDRSTVLGSWVAFALVPEGMVGGFRKRRIVVAHDIGHGHADALLLVVQHQHRTAVGAEADFQRAV